MQQQQEPALSSVDEQTVSYVYNRYIELLQQDKNASIEQILREEPFASHLRETASYTDRQIEQAVIEKLYHEEETQDIQQMIAKFYNKFDELHE